MLEYLMVFLLGMLTTYTLSYLMALGNCVLLLKEAQKSCAGLFLISEQGLYEVLNLKYIAMEEAQRTEQNITAQKYIDHTNVDSLRKTIMRNYLRQFPDKYRNTLEYTNWEEMEQYFNNVTKETKGKSI